MAPLRDDMPVPVVSIAEMRQWEEATWAAGRTPESVINCVGERVAQRVSGLIGNDGHILVLAGKGHNGDDAKATASHMAGARVEVVNVSDPASDLGILQEALARQPLWIIDGLFGIGLSRPLDCHWQEFISAVNRSGCKVLSVDVPSGLNADTGESLGAAIRARITVTLGAPKKGLILTKAEEFVGRLEVEPEIGLIGCPLSGGLLWTLPTDFVEYPPPRPDGAHKGCFGHLIILAGSLGYHGAAVLAARAAQRAQPGLITLCTVPPAYVPVASQLQAVMVQAWMAVTKWPERATAVLAGPGLAAVDLPQEVRAQIARWWLEAKVPVVVDASALDWLPAGAIAGDAVRVITPHPGEAARMLSTDVKSVQSDRPAAARELSRRHGGCWVVLKGRHTLVGRERGPLWVNPSGNPLLAQGGSGDVLAGYLAGLLAQPGLQGDVCRALCYGVWQHGAVADHLAQTRRNWVVEELIDQLGNMELADPHCGQPFRGMRSAPKPEG